MEETKVNLGESMECPKCHTKIKEDQTVCPKCHKVLLLECPNCHSLEDSAICSHCGYHILIKCSKCGRLNPAINDLCVKCGFPTKTSLAYQECESDEIASVIIKFNNLKSIRRLLKSRELYEKFYVKLKNLILAYVKSTEGLFIIYGDVFVLNFNKELSFPTSSNKAVRFSLKLANALTQLNLNILEQLKIPLGLNITIVKKNAENLQELTTYDNNVKLLTVKKGTKNYLKGTQIILDQYVCDEVNREYKTDSLYSTEDNGKMTMFYELILDSYILPPDTSEDTSNTVAIQRAINKTVPEDDGPQDIHSFKVFDINAKCSFQTTNAVSIKDKLLSLDFQKNAKIISLRSKPEYSADVADIIQICEQKGLHVISVTCTDSLVYKPWGFFEKLFKEYYDIPYFGQNDPGKFNPQQFSALSPLLDLCNGLPLKSSTPEDARFAYMELWGKFLSILSDTAIIIDGFEHLDDTSIQTLEFYFDKFRNVKPNFIFITNDEVSVHSKIKTLLKTNVYTELKLEKSSFSSCLSTIKSDASDFIGSFYFEKIQENFKGSYLYFKYAMQYLKETSVLIDFENKLLVKSSKAVVINNNLFEMYKSRMKYFGKNQDISFIMAYSALIYPGLDLKTLTALGIKDVNACAKTLVDVGLARLEGSNLVINNYTIFADIITSSLKKEAETMLAKSILSKLGAGIDNTTAAMMMGKMGKFKEEYMTLCINADHSINTGDYDAYLKNCLGFLSLIESVSSIIPEEDIEERKKEVFNSILEYLYSYAPAKIYFIENILLTDAINENDNDKIVKLSNLMLQGALISSNYTDALGLLHNILSRMSNPTLIVDGAINTKFLLLSLVHIEILYNIGKFRECVDIAKEILSVIKIEIIDKIKPASFSINSFVSHLLETFRLAAFAKLYLMDNDIENFLELISITLNTELPEHDCVLAVRDFLAGKVYSTGNIEEYSAFSKVVLLILQEVTGLMTNADYKRFAQNIYQAKLLSDEIYQPEIKYLCDLLIAYAYAKIGITAKASYIYDDVINHAEKSAMFNILIIAKYLLAISETDITKKIQIISDCLNIIRRHDNQAVILYVLFETLYIKTVQENNLTETDIEAEEQKIAPYQESLKLIVE